MFSKTFMLLQNEGYLMQGCFKSALSDLREAPSAQPGPFYAAFFNYAIRLERLLKILLLLDKWHRERKFLTDGELRKKGHNVKKLYEEARTLFPQYAVAWKDAYEPDKINRDLLNFLAGFANGSRYYNLDALAGASPQHAEDPIHCWQRLLYLVYEKDFPGAEPIVTSPDAPEDSMSNSDLAGHHVIIAAASRHMCCRLVQLLVPLQELLIAISQEIRQDDFQIGGDDTAPSIPADMNEFLDFVCGEKATILECEDWPY
jgi:hypothetical protein